MRLPDSLMVKVAEWQSQHFSQLESFGAEDVGGYLDGLGPAIHDSIGPTFQGDV